MHDLSNIQSIFNIYAFFQSMLQYFLLAVHMDEQPANGHVTGHV